MKKNNVLLFHIFISCFKPSESFNVKQSIPKFYLIHKNIIFFALFSPPNSKIFNVAENFLFSCQIKKIPFLFLFKNYFTMRVNDAYSTCWYLSHTLCNINLV